MTVTELRRGSEVVDRVAGGEVVVVSRHGRPAAMLVPLADPERLLPIDVDADDVAELAAMFEQRARRRRNSELMHGRWWNGHGIHGPYRRRRRPR